MDMTKFDSPEDPGFIDISTTLWRWTRDLANERSALANLTEKDQERIEEPENDKERIIQQWSGKNITRDGRVFQGNINTTGNVNIG